MPSEASRFSRKLDWNLLKVFHDIVEAGGVSRASQLLARKQPTVSLALKRLENQLGATLCRRGPGGFELTDEGQLMAEACQRLTGLIGGLPDRLANVAEHVRGRIRIQLISSIVNSILDTSIAVFHARHPQVEIVVDVTTWEVVAGALLRNEIDIGVAPARFQRADLRYDLLFREIHRPYCGRSHRLFGRRITDLADIADEPIILTGADEPDELAKYRLRYGLGRRVAGLSEHLEEAKRLAILGVGLCFLPEGFAAPDVAAGRLWPLTRRTTEPSMALFVITNPKAPPHLARQLFLEELRGRLHSPAKPRVGAAKRARPRRDADDTRSRKRR